MLNVGVLFCNNEEMVQPFLFFLRKSSPGMELKVNALDNGSRDNTFDNFMKHKQPQDKIISLAENVGCPRGGNTILRSLYDEYGFYPTALWLDSDVFIYLKDSVKNMHAILENSDTDIVFGKSYSADNNRIGDSGISFVMFKHGVFDKVGLFDERYQAFHYDCDFFHEAKYKCKMKVCEKAYAVHFWGSTLTTGSEGKRRKEIVASDKRLSAEKWAKRK